MGPNAAEYIHTVHEAIKLAYDDRNAYLGDPAFASVPLKGPALETLRGRAPQADRPEGFLEHRPGDPYPSIRRQAARRPVLPALAGRQRIEHVRRHHLRGRVDKTEICSAPRRVGLAARRRVHRRRHGRAALESHAGLRSGSGQPERAGRRQAPRTTLTADDSC